MTRNHSWTELFGSIVYGFAFVIIVTTILFGIFGFDLFISENDKIKDDIGTTKDQVSQISSLNSSASLEE